ncbi:calcium-dependent protein kinase family protein [Babesia bovis T2Bo]|uniref:Calcium-dependent protein kinase, putative n=1 Tax=Babesia bovis TaxID=5865 RepID=A7AUV3_BABBO|nr:calcium-dependent protein kinase family protein [Babesia bovis T2Bo]EDO06714.1 calcium-dependent protein kinase family protein [Babesia bovis T2Bo]|eukprot:XP_001610282.1 calcium-dependent protein kinase [Babesia bovis T2Bo]
MGNCCSHGSVIPKEHRQHQSNRGVDRKGDDDAISPSKLHHIPKICDAFVCRLGRLVKIINLPSNKTNNDIESDHKGQSLENNDWEAEQLNSCVDHESLTEESNDSIYENNRIHVNPGLRDMMLTRDLWRSRIVTWTNITENYSVISDAIGVGVGGSVHQAVDKKSHRTFALKTLKTDFKFRKRLISTYNEIAIYTQLDHPNIAFLHEVYEEPGSCHLLMEHCNGGELYDRLEKYKRFAEGYAKSVTVQMLLAINYLHNNGICHRDLKLENWVFATQDMGALLKMIDFGFSRLYEDGVPMAGTHGTVYYVDPEVIDGSYSEKCDVWSTGVIVYMLLSGSPPFNGEGDKEILWKIKKGQLRFEGVRWVKITDEAKDFITYLLNRDSSKRASAIEALKHPWLNEELQRFDDTVLTKEIVDHIIEFSNKPAFYRALLALCVMETDRKIHPNAYRLFFAINKSLSGTISLEEFAEAVRRFRTIDDEDIDRIFDTIAFRGTPTMHYTEFVTSVYGYYSDIDLQAVTRIYHKMESLGNGRFDVTALRACMGKEFNSVPIETMIAEVDINNNGVIELAELQKCLLSVH